MPPSRTHRSGAEDGSSECDHRGGTRRTACPGPASADPSSPVLRRRCPQQTESPFGANLNAFIDSIDPKRTLPEMARSKERPTQRDAGRAVRVTWPFALRRPDSSHGILMIAASGPGNAVIGDNNQHKLDSQRPRRAIGSVRNLYGDH